MDILVVDDEEIVLNTCQRILVLESYNVVLSKSVKEALMLLKKNDFSAILVDMKMPENDSINLMKIVKKKWPELPVIIMSGYATNEAVTQALHMGAYAFIPKPFTPEELMAVVDDVVKKGIGIKQDDVHE